MISILIPVFNTDIRKLVQTLHEQCSHLNSAFEILIIDDGSDKRYLDINSTISSYSNLFYFERNINRGRIQTRKELAEKAKYDWVLFLDSDVLIFNVQFIHNYITALNNKANVIIGGTVFLSIKPADCIYTLHWKYATERVDIKKQKLKKSLYTGFLFNNVLVEKKFFEKLDFPSSLTGYGHEDTWVGIQLDKLNARLLFIENPVMHECLDDAELFFHKNRNALYNLKSLAQLTDAQTLSKHVRLFKFYMLLEKYRLGPIFIIIISIFKKAIKKNLKSCNPNLMLFDLYRLKMFYLIMKNKK